MASSSRDRGSIEMWNNAELTSVEEWRAPSPSSVYQPELFGAGLDAAKLPPSTILPDGSVGAMQRDAARPASPGTVETLASKLRSLSFAAARPRSGQAAGRAAQYVAAGDALKEQLRSQQSERLRQVAPALACRLDAALLASCGVLLATEHADGGFEWASWHVEQLRQALPHHEAAFPGAYYREIFGADVSQLATSLAEVAHATSRRRAAAADALDALVRCEGASAARLESAAQAAEAVGAEEEGRSARAVAKLATRATEAEQRMQAVEAELHALKRSGSDAAAAAKRAAERERELEARLKAAEDGRNALQLKLTVEADARRKVEAASVKTLEQLKVQEEARWAAERLLQQESARLSEQQILHRRAEEEARRVPPPVIVCAAALQPLARGPAAKSLVPRPGAGLQSGGGRGAASREAGGRGGGSRGTGAGGGEAEGGTLVARGVARGPQGAARAAAPPRARGERAGARAAAALLVHKPARF